MKRALVLAGVIAIASTMSCYAADTNTLNTPLKSDTAVQKPYKQNVQRPPKMSSEAMEKKKAEFEKRLKLTDEQKAKAQSIRTKGHEEMKPVMEQIKSKHEQIKTIKQNSLTDAEKSQIETLRNEIRELDKQARELRLKNMKEFESILTEKQQKELKTMKEEGRKNFEKRHRNNGQMRPPFPKKGPMPPAQDKDTPPVLNADD